MIRLCNLQLVVALLALVAVNGLSQTFQAELTGVVHDATGAVVPNAKVTATNKATGVSFSTTSNEQGIYRLPTLPPAQYKISVRINGFKTFEQGPITLQVNDVVEAPVTLQLGDASEKIVVSATAEALQTATASIGQVVNTRQSRICR